MIGKLQAVNHAITLTPLQLRNLQRLSIIAQRNLLNYESMIMLTKDCLTDLKWWIQSLTLLKGKPFRLDHPDMTLFSDAASSTGWGACTEEGLRAGGPWTIYESQNLHINQMELIAAERAIKAFTKDLIVSHVLIFIENQVALSYLTKMGGTKCPHLTQVARRICKYAEKQNFTISALWIPSKENVIADQDSRESQIQANGSFA